MADLPKPYLSAHSAALILGPNVHEALYTADQLRAYADARVAEAVARCAQLVREAWSVHGLCCSDAGALADLIEGLDNAAIRGAANEGEKSA